MNEISVIFTIFVLCLVKGDLLIYKMHNCDDMR